MGEISSTDARALFTKSLIAVYQERIYPTKFFRSFFKSQTEPTKEISIEVERMGEKVAVDVVRGTEGNRNQFSKSTEKIFVPPYYREYFDATELDLYDRVLGSQGNAQIPLFEALLNKVSDKLGLLRDKIDRAIELQAVNVLDTGILTLNTGGTINFQRRAISIVSKSGSAWSTGSNNPFNDVEDGCNFIRKYGRYAGEKYSLIMASDVGRALFANTTFLARQNLFHMQFDQVYAPVKNAEGATYHGTITAGSYKVDLWMYPQFYDLKAGTDLAPTYTQTPYIPAGKAYLIPEQPKFHTAFAAVPQLVGEPGQLPTQGEFVIGEFLDTRRAKHDFDIQSAPVCIPVAVDQIYTLKDLV